MHQARLEQRAVRQEAPLSPSRVTPPGLQLKVMGSPWQTRGVREETQGVPRQRKTC